MPEVRPKQVLNIAAIAAIAAISTSDPTAADPHVAPNVDEPRQVSGFELAAQSARFTLMAETGQIVLTSVNERTRYEIEMTMTVDGVERPIAVRKEDVVRKEGNPSSLTATFPVQLGQDRVEGMLALVVDPKTSHLSTAVMVPSRTTDRHVLSLRLSVSPGSAEIFIPEHGELGDLGEVETRSVVLDDDVHPVAIATRDGSTFMVGENAPELETHPGAKPRLTSTIHFAAAAGEPFRAEASILMGDSSDVFWGALYGLLGVPVARVSGIIGGAAARAEVFAVDEEGHAFVRVPTSARRFVVDAPLQAVRWYATLEAAQTSTSVTRFQPGSGNELRLDALQGGELRVRVLDADTGLPVLARIVVRGVEGAVDPTFGHDFRVSGAGPLVDSRTGEVKTTLAPGRYRVSALKGLEWSIDSEIVDMASRTGRTVELRPRHVVPTPGLVACDLHVHARPSFDSPVTPEDRLLSLASAGIDFAVPTEHNIIGDYTEAVDQMDLKGQIAHVTGIEVTTSNPALGHFGVFPYPKSAGVLPYNHTTAKEIFSAARKGDPSRVLAVHHPRISTGMGYFQSAGLDTRTGKFPSGMRTDFDVIEIYNGYEIMTRAKTEAVLVDWFALLNMGKRYAATGSSDSHRIQFHWAGYPRTYVRLDPTKAGDTGAPIDANAVVSAVKKGEGFVTSGPILDFEVGGAKPGAEASVQGGRVRAHLQVRAAPWVDVSSVEIIAGGTSVYKNTVDPRPTVTGKEHGSYDEAAYRAVRFDSQFDLTIPTGAKWVVAIARGERPYDDVLPFMPVQPLGFTNPIRLKN